MKHGAKIAEYRVTRLMPVRRNEVVFAAYWYASYACNPRAIYETMRRIAPQYNGTWVVKKGSAVPEGVSFVVAGSRAYYRLLARAGVFVNNVGFPDHWRKRPGTVLVHTHHGTPLKHMGLDQHLDDRSAKAVARHLSRWSRWDYSLSSNPHSTLVWEHAYPGTYTTLEYGYPRNDRLAMASSTEVESVRATLGLPPEGRVLLYAPTHREYEPGFRPLLDVERLSEDLGPDWTVLARAHYFYRNEGTASSGPGGVLDVTDHPSIEDLCLAADVLVTDYSSLMFDYAVLDRPIVIFAPDWETYRTKRGVYFDLLHEAPGVVCRTAQELAATLASGEYETEAAGSARKVFRERFCGWEDGHASERVVRRVLLGETPGDPPG